MTLGRLNRIDPISAISSITSPANPALRVAVMVIGVVFGVLSSAPSMAETIANPIAQFSGLDKITGRVTSFDVYMNETVQFGALQITPKVCYTRAESETPSTSVFMLVDQIDLDGKLKRIFTGWMFAESPALNSIDHPIYDVWLTDCKQTSNVPPPETPNTDSAASSGAPATGTAASAADGGASAQ